MPETCTIHLDRPEECPQEHICECGAALSDHHTVATYCPNRVGVYRPSAATLDRFPSQYKHLPEWPV